MLRLSSRSVGNSGLGEKEQTDKARELGTAIDLIALVGPALLTGEPVAALIGTAALGGKRLIDNYVFRRQKKLDQLVQERLDELKERIDEKVKVDEFVALYIRARETAARSEREEKLKFIRNVLLNAVIEPTSSVVDKEPYLRLLDEFSSGELQTFIGFSKAALAAHFQTFADFLHEPKRAYLMVHSYARHTLGLPVSGPNTAELQTTEARIAVTLRRFEAITLLDGVRTGGVGEPYAFQTNQFTADFLRFVLDPADPNAVIV
jgi:ribosomal protein S13